MPYWCLIMQGTDGEHWPLAALRVRRQLEAKAMGEKTKLQLATSAFDAQVFNRFPLIICQCLGDFIQLRSFRSTRLFDCQLLPNFFPRICREMADMEATGEQSASVDKSFGGDIEMGGQEAAGPVVAAEAENVGEHENGGEGTGEGDGAVEGAGEGEGAVEGTGEGEGEGEGEGGSGELMAPAEEQPEEPRRLTYVDYFKSPIVALQIGQDEPTTLTAHQALLEYSPFFAEACAHNTSDRPVRADIFWPRHGTDICHQSKSSNCRKRTWML